MCHVTQHKVPHVFLIPLRLRQDNSQHKIVLVNFPREELLQNYFKKSFLTHAEFWWITTPLAPDSITLLKRLPNTISHKPLLCSLNSQPSLVFNSFNLNWNLHLIRIYVCIFHVLTLRLCSVLIYIYAVP